MADRETRSNLRSRSRSPNRHSKKSKAAGGFRWKDKPRSDAPDERGNDTNTHLERGYRNREDDRPHRRRDDRDEEEDRPRRKENKHSYNAPEEERDRRRDEREEREEQAVVAPEATAVAGSDAASKSGSDAAVKLGTEPTKQNDPGPIDDDIAAKFGASAAAKFGSSGGNKASGAQASNVLNKQDSKSNDRASKPRKQAPLVMMRVFVNDRLGTKTEVPCAESDTVGQFKAFVAAKIGRPKEMIMLKRQGERPFKDHITLGDYGVSSGVQLDLELAT